MVEGARLPVVVAGAISLPEGFTKSTATLVCVGEVAEWSKALACRSWWRDISLPEGFTKSTATLVCVGEVAEWSKALAC